MRARVSNRFLFEQDLRSRTPSPAGPVTGARPLPELLEDQVFLWHEAKQEVTTMHDRLLRRRQVEEITGMSRSSIYRQMQDGAFPRPVKVGSAAVRWRASDITAWLESRPEARGEIEPPTDASECGDARIGRT